MTQQDTTENPLLETFLGETVRQMEVLREDDDGEVKAKELLSEVENGDVKEKVF